MSFLIKGLIPRTLFRFCIASVTGGVVGIPMTYLEMFQFYKICLLSIVTNRQSRAKEASFFLTNLGLKFSDDSSLWFYQFVKKVDGVVNLASCFYFHTLSWRKWSKTEFYTEIQVLKETSFEVLDFKLNDIT